MICAAAVLMPGRWVSRTVLQAEHCQKMCSSFSGALPQYGHVDVALRIHKLRPYTHRPRRTAQEVEEHRLQRALQGNLQLGLAPSSEQTTFAKGGGAAPPLQLISSL